MKQKIFTLIMMLALVIVAGRAFAQSSWDVPYIGTEHTYAWGNVTCATHSFAVTTGTADPTDGAVAEGATTWTAGTTSSGVLANATASIEITWNSATDGNTYYVWISATSSATCTNYRFVQVDPESHVDFEIHAKGILAESSTPTEIDAAGEDDAGDDCPSTTTIDGEDYNETGGSDDGDVYVYFVVYEGADNPTDTWTVDFTADAGTAEYWNGTAWAANATVTGIASGATAYFRTMIATPTTSTTINGSISNAAQETTGLTDEVNTNDDVDFTVNPIPAIGGFSGS